MGRKLAAPQFVREWERIGFTQERETAGDTHATFVETGSLTMNMSVSIDANLRPRYQTVLRSRDFWVKIYKGDDSAAARGTFLQTARVLGVKNIPRTRVGGVYSGLRNLLKIVKLPLSMALSIDIAEREGGTVTFVRVLEGHFVMASVPGNVRQQAQQEGIYAGHTDNDTEVLFLKTTD